MNPWIIVAVLAGLIGSFLGGFEYGGKIRQEHLEAQQLKEKDLVDTLDKHVASYIAGIEVKHVTIKQQLDKEFHDVPVPTDCTVSDRVLQLTNAALSGTVSVDNSGVPAADPTDRKGP